MTTPNLQKMPILGLGTWKLKGKECEKVVEVALEVGYRHIDTADIYQNHKEIGKAIQKMARHELFVTSKVFLHELENESVTEACNRYLDELQTSYLDLLLIHWPKSGTDMRAILQQMKALQDNKLVHRIGVSNFTIEHLQTLTDFSLFNNQVELHPYFQQEKLAAYCAQNNITLTAYRPINKGEIDDDSTLKEIAKAHSKTAIQVALRWLIQRNICAIPKASCEKHLKENLDIFDFELSDDEMQKIHSLNREERGINPSWSEF